MLATPERRRQRLAAIRETVDRRRGADPQAVFDFHIEPATADEREAFGFATIGRPRPAVARAHEASPAPRRTREHRSPSTTRTTSRRARPSATSAADPSSSRVRLSADALGALRIETTRLGFRLALLGIGGAR